MASLNFSSIANATSSLTSSLTINFQQSQGVWKKPKRQLNLTRKQALDLLNAISNVRNKLEPIRNLRPIHNPYDYPTNCMYKNITSLLDIAVDILGQSKLNEFSMQMLIDSVSLALDLSKKVDDEFGSNANWWDKARDRAPRNSEVGKIAGSIDLGNMLAQFRTSYTSLKEIAQNLRKETEKKIGIRLDATWVTQEIMSSIKSPCPKSR